MTRKRTLKVYGWIDIPHLDKDHPITKDHRFRAHRCQLRAVIAAHSQAEAAKLTGHDRPSQMFNLCETGNVQEIAVAMAQPGVQFIAPMDGGLPITFYPLKNLPEAC